MYAIICVDVATTKKKIKLKYSIFKKLLEFRNQFDNEKVEILSDQDKKDHDIDLMKSQKSFFILLYNLS